MKFSYTIYDAPPSQCGGVGWLHQQDVEIEADSDDDALEQVQDILSEEACYLSKDDGYEIGQKIYANIWNEDGEIIGTLNYTLTEDDLGIEDEYEEDDEEDENA